MPLHQAGTARFPLAAGRATPAAFLLGGIPGGRKGPGPINPVSTIWLPFLYIPPTPPVFISPGWPSSPSLPGAYRDSKFKPLSLGHWIGPRGPAFTIGCGISTCQSSLGSCARFCPTTGTVSKAAPSPSSRSPTGGISCPKYGGGEGDCAALLGVVWSSSEEKS